MPYKLQLGIKICFKITSLFWCCIITLPIKSHCAATDCQRLWTMRDDTGEQISVIYLRAVDYHYDVLLIFLDVKKTFWLLITKLFLDKIMVTL